MKDIARQIGQVVPDTSIDSSGTPALSRQQQELAAVNSLQLHEAWDILDALKKLITEDKGKVIRTI